MRGSRRRETTRLPTEEQKNRTETQTYTETHTHSQTHNVEYNNDAFKKMPQLELCVNTHKHNCMVDSGAGYSVVRMSDLPTSPKMSSRFFFSQCASGTTVKEYFTKSLPCTVQFGKHPIRFEHDFLLFHL